MRSSGRDDNVLAAKAAIDFSWALRRGLKPRPFKT
jgi:hypothetical protein